MKPRSTLWLGIAVILGVFLAFLGGLLIGKPYAYQGSLIEPPIPAKDFVLTDQHRQPFHLADYQGEVVLLFFGYTYCPDVCPATLTDLKFIFDQLGEQSDKVKFVFITVDPDRDTPDQLERHLKLFNPNFIGLTGEFTELEKVWGDYGVYRAKQDSTSDTAYLVEHTARVYVIDQSNQLRLTFPFGMDREGMLKDIQQLLKES